MYAAENRGSPQGFNSLSLSLCAVSRRDGWVARGIPHKQHACLRHLDANDRPRSQTWKVARDKRRRTRSHCFVGRDRRLHSEVHHYSPRGVFDLAPPRLSLMHAAPLWLHLRSAVLRIVTNSDSESSNKQSPEEDG